jgi:saccharopine dehydrogenase-like NADP-dependent oxidoreductase
MKVLVFGGNGKMGQAVAFDLAKDDSVEQIGLVGRTEKTLKQAKAWLKSPKVVLHVLDVDDRKATMKLMDQYDVGVSTLPDRHTSYVMGHSAVEAGLSYVDMLEEYHRRPDLYELEGLKLPKGVKGLDEYGDWLHETAKKNGVTFMDGIGFAPGLSNIVSGEAIRKLDKAEICIARVGGIPRKDVAQYKPLRYMITWAFWHVLREYNVKLFIIKNGKKVEVDAATERESFHFDKYNKDEMLECAITPGMPSFIYTRPKLKYFAEKTVRWPGHWGGVQTLKECGLLSKDPVVVDGVKVVPRDLLLACIEPQLTQKPGETDVCVLYCTVEGLKDGKRQKISYHMWDEADKKNGISSMGRVTGFPAAIGAVMVGKGMIKEKGIVPPEECFYGANYEYFMKELKKRKINILETIEPL